MFVMRPATADDQEPIAAMIRTRSEWMRLRGISGWQGWGASAAVLGAQAADPGFPVWVMADGGSVAGCTSVYEQSPPWFWTAAEQGESAFFLATTVTDPLAGRRVGALMAWSVLDLAARTGREWVRRGTTEAGLVRYYRDVQGWSVVREKEHKGFLFTGLARRAELQPGLPVRAWTADIPEPFARQAVRVRGRDDSAKDSSVRHGSMEHLLPLLEALSRGKA